MPRSPGACTTGLARAAPVPRLKRIELRLASGPWIASAFAQGNAVADHSHGTSRPFWPPPAAPQALDLSRLGCKRAPYAQGPLAPAAAMTPSIAHGARGLRFPEPGSHARFQCQMGDRRQLRRV